MNGLKLVFDMVISFFNTNLSFGSVSFAVWQYMLGVSVLGIVVSAIKNFFE